MPYTSVGEDSMNRWIGISFVFLALGCAGASGDDVDATASSDATNTADGSPLPSPDTQSPDADVTDPAIPPEDTVSPSDATGNLDAEEDVNIPQPDISELDPNICTGLVTEPLQPYGGSCCYTADWHPGGNDGCAWYQDDYGDGACVDLQCITGQCSRPASYCTKECELGKDEQINSLEIEGFDGVTDPEESNDCEGAADGPYGTEYHCTNYTDNVHEKYGVCRPGTTFGECNHNSDCPEGEVCTLIYIAGKTDSRCVQPGKESVKGTDACNTDPNDGVLANCQGPSCFSFGCADLCSTHDQCATDQCVDGACLQSPDVSCTTDSECSAWECSPEIKFYSNSDYTHDQCWPKACPSHQDCVDPDWFCQLYWNGEDTIEAAGMAPSCRKKEEGFADYGEACGIEGDGTDLPACVYQDPDVCINGVCAGPCLSDEDCPGEQSECLMADTWNLDVDDDGSNDKEVNVDLCVQWPHDGELTDCTTDSDCPEAHHCEFRVRGEGAGPERTWRIEYKCKKTLSFESEYGEECNEGLGQKCTSGLCLKSTSEVEYQCSTYCQSSDDCPEYVEYDDKTWKTICLSLNQSENNTPADATDDLYLPYCWRTSSIGSIEPCDENRQCESSLEYCRALPVAGNPDEAVVVDHRCLDASQGLSDIPELQVGEPCTSWSQCVGRVCLPDQNGNGYCSELCGTDADCSSEEGIEGLVCSPEELIARADPALSGFTQRCILQASCVSCELDADCGGDFVCVNAGGLEELADFRCAAPCETQVDCTENGGICKENIGPSGAPSGFQACIPNTCD
jgi:hypothetical protein